MKVKPNQRLFEDWNRITERVKTFRSIVQNPMTITYGQYEDWARKSQILINDLEILRTETMLEVLRQNMDKL